MARGALSYIQAESSAANPDCLPSALRVVGSDSGASEPVASTRTEPESSTRASHLPSSAGARAGGMI